MTFCIKLALLVFVFAVVVIVLAGVSIRIFGYLGIDAKWLLSEKKEVTFRTEILERIKNVNELHTGIASVQTIVANSQGKRVCGWEIGSTKLLYVAVGVVRAGINLADLKPEDVIADGTHIRVRLPVAKVIDSKIDVEKSYCYDVRRSLVMSPDAIGLQEDAQRKALGEITAAAVKCGVIEMATTQAKNILTSLLEMAGFDSVDITFSQPAPDG